LANVSIFSPRDEVSEILDECRIVVCPSLWKEQFGRIIFEAAANGAVVIASGIPSLLENAGKAAVFVQEYKVPERWKEAIEEFDDEALYEAQSRKGQEYVLANYDLTKPVEQFHALASSIMPASGRL
jgi:glycosyltransferase involved in cell wall biosynthesis